MWASDAPVGAFSQQEGYYDKNLSEFINKFSEYYNDNKMLNNLMYNNAKTLFCIKS